MKFFKITIALSLILAVAASMAQSVSTVKTGAEVKLKTNEHVRRILGSDNEGFYVLSSTMGIGGTMEEKFFVSKYDNTTLALKWIKDFSLNVSSQPFEDAFLLKDKVVVLYSSWEKSDNTKALNVKTFSANGEVTDLPNKEARIKSGMFDFVNRDFYFSFSPDSSKLLVVNKFQDKKKPEEVSAVVLDVNGFKKISEKSISNMYKEARVASYKYRIDNTGNIFYLVSYLSGELVQNSFCILNTGASQASYMDLKLVTGRVSNSDLFLRIKDLKYNKNGIKFIENANEITYDLSANNQATVMGLFKDFKQNKVGVFQYTIDTKSGKSLSNTEQFFDATTESRLNALGKEKSPIGYDYRMNTLFNQKGSLIVFASVFKIKGYSNESNLLSDRYDDLILAFKPSGLVWSGAFPGGMRDIGTEKDIVHAYKKDNSIFYCSGVYDSKRITGTCLEAFKSQFEEAATQKKDMAFIEITDAGIKNIVGYAMNDKKASVLLTDQFLTMNGNFLLPISYFNNVTGSNSAIKFSLLEWK